MKNLILLCLITTFISCDEIAISEFMVTVSSNPVEGGVVTPESGKFLEGEKVKLQAKPNEGYTFISWSGDLVGTNNPQELIVNGEKDIIALFEQIDSEAPTLTISPTSQQIEIGENFNQPTVSAYDIVDGDISHLVVTEGLNEIDTSVVGTYEIHYKVTDSAGNESNAVFTLIIESNDSDKDGVLNKDDFCPDTPWGNNVNIKGCATPIYQDDNGIIRLDSSFSGAVVLGERYRLDESEESQSYELVENSSRLGVLVSSNQDYTHVCTSLVTDTNSMFYNNRSIKDITSWDMSNVVNMRLMFGIAIGFNQEIGNWNVEKVENMHGMFAQCSDFNADISEWNVSNVTKMSSMFYSATSFNKNIGNWNVSSVTDMSFMFHDTAEFSQDIGAWNVSNVTNMSSMFSYTKKFDRNIGDWNTSKVTNMQRMFERAEIFNQNIGNWNTSRVTTMQNMFLRTSVFNTPIENWNVSKVTNMGAMFSESQFNQPIGNWDVSSVTTMARMFEGSVFNQDIKNWNVSSVTTMEWLFANSLFDNEIGNWNVSKVNNMWRMFSNSVFNQNIGNWNVSSVSDMTSMFFGASKFNRNISSWNVSQTIYMSFMFENAVVFNQDLSSWDVDQVTYFSDFDSGATAWVNQDFKPVFTMTEN